MQYTTFAKKMPPQKSLFEGGFFWGETEKTEGESSEKSYFTASLPYGTGDEFLPPYCECREQTERCALPGKRLRTAAMYPA